MSIRILLIEDNLDHILFTKKILGKENGQFKCDSVSEAKEGLKKLIEENYDLVLCDYRLPGFTALDILREMRNKGKDLPLVTVTASGNEKVAVDLMKEGAYDYVVKDVLYEVTLPVVIKRSIERFNAKKEKERLERKIKEAAEEWESTFNSITDLISIHNKDFKIVRVNKVFADMFKMNPEEIMGKTCYEIFHGTKEPANNCPHKQVLETKKAVEVEFFEPRLGIFFEVSVSPIINEKGEVISTVHTAKDITARKKAEEMLWESQERYRALVENTTFGISVIDTNYKIIMANTTLAKLFKKPASDFVGKNCFREFEKREGVCSHCPGMRAMVSGRTEEVETQGVRDDGSRFYVRVRAIPFLKSDGVMKGFIEFIEDIDARKRTEEELRVAYKDLQQAQQDLIQAGKMAAMGQLAAGISHELNQPLTGIKGFTQAVLMDLEKESPFRDDLNKIVVQVDRMDTIMKNMRFFSRKSDFNMLELDINQVVLNSLMLLSQQLKIHNIRVIQELGSGIPKIQGDPNQLQQAFLNLISNAQDAILGLNRPDEGGEIRIRTSLSQDKNHIKIIFQDTGCGIPDECLQYIFSPFFTTKSPDRGMGLGLSITYRIIENHQGKINFKTKADEGTIFCIVLPVKVSIG